MQQKQRRDIIYREIKLKGGVCVLKIAICDDQPIFSAEIKTLLDQWKNKPLGMSVKCYSDGDSLITAHKAAPFDIILLDVVMPLIDGIETARELRVFDTGVKLVFLTSSPEFAVESYTVKASNYLLKPVNASALYGCLAELFEELQRSNMSITVKCSDATHRVPLDKIEYIEAYNKHTFFALSGGGSIEALGLMNTYESKLLSADGFFKCHRSYIVNIHQIGSYTSKDILTRSGRRVPISRNSHKEFEEAYFSTIFGKAGDM